MVHFRGSSNFNTGATSGQDNGTWNSLGTSFVAVSGQVIRQGLDTISFPVMPE